ncbi:MAG: hydroxyacid dehydrogenase [Rickettsiales bacterium]|nr:hydroxyacid dehydrogenase [Rickettsiales bacterium]
MSNADKIKLAILDDYASIAPAHFSSITSHVEIHSFPETLNARITSEHDALIKRLEPFTIVSSMRERTQFPRSVLSSLPNLKFLLTTGMKNAAIDISACTELGITVVGTGPKPNAVKGYDATNEMTWALILGLTKDLVGGDAVVKGSPNGWQSSLVSGLSGKTLGLLGLGRLGTQAAATGMLGFGMDVLAWSSSLTQDKADEAAKSRGLPAGSFKVAGSKTELFEKADVLSVHYVLSDRSRAIVGSEELGAMKPSAILVNTSRGPLVDESSLVQVLEAGKIRGAGLDVFDTEPLPGDSPWRRDGYWGSNGRSKLLLSPHMGYVEEETMHAWYEQQVAAVKAWLKGEGIKGVIC